MGPIGERLVDLDRYRLPAELVGELLSRRRPPRHRPGESFIKGPIPFDWVASASRLPGSGFRVAMACRFLCCRYRAPNRWGLESIARGLCLSSKSTRRGLHAAELAGVLTVERRPGCKLAVSIPSPPDGARSKYRPLYGPIPWSWWLPASRLPGMAPQFGAACWLVAGWERSAEFEMGLAEWSELGLSRGSASRGLAELIRAGLVSTRRRSGRSPIVTILDASSEVGGKPPGPEFSSPDRTHQSQAPPNPN